MAKIVLGMWTTHGPTLGTTAEQWPNRIEADKKRRHPFRKKEYSFDELVRAGKVRHVAAPWGKAFALGTVAQSISPRSVAVPSGSALDPWPP